MNIETGVGVCATVIALGSFWISWGQARASRAHNRQSVRPLVLIRTVRAGYRDDVARLEVINAGIGPAVVTRTSVTLDGAVIGQWDLPTYHQMARGLPMLPKVKTLFTGAALIPGERSYLLHLEERNGQESAWFWELISTRLLVEIRYESLYGGEDFVARSTLL